MSFGPVKARLMQHYQAPWEPQKIHVCTLEVWKINYIYPLCWKSNIVKVWSKLTTNEHQVQGKTKTIFEDPIPKSNCEYLIISDKSICTQVRATLLVRRSAKNCAGVCTFGSFSDNFWLFLTFKNIFGRFFLHK